MFIISIYRRSANQYIEIPSHPVQTDYQMNNDKFEDVEGERIPNTQRVGM
jgi:hypothetical protein